MAMREFIDESATPRFRPTTAELERAIVTRSGACFQGPLLHLDSIHTGYGLHRSAEQYIVGIASLIRRGLRIEATKFPTIVFHNSWTGGYYHWMTEALPRLFSVSYRWSSSAILIPPRVPNSWFVPWLKEIGRFAGHVEFIGGRNVFLRQAIVPKNPTRQDEFDVDNLSRVRDAILHAAGVDQQRNATRLVYITRRNARYRKVPNEQQIIDALRPMGFEICDFDSLDYPEQIRTVAHARVLVSIHGAGLTNLMFMTPGSHVVEGAMRPVYPLTYNRLRRSHLVNPSYVRLSRRFDVNHHLVLCEIDLENEPSRSDKKININDYNLYFDEERLLELLRNIL